MKIRQLQEADYQTIIEAIDDWFDGRQMSALLPRIFIIYFRPTGFAIEEDGRVIGFLAGFVSQTCPDQAYIHFVGIEANYLVVVSGASSTQDFSRLFADWLHDGSLHYFAGEQRIYRVSHSNGLLH